MIARLRTRLASEAGNGLILLPVGVVVMLGIIGWAIDSTMAWRSQLAAQHVADAIANDAAGQVARDSLYTGEPRLDEARIANLVSLQEGAQADSRLNIDCTHTIDSFATPPSVTITCGYDVNYVLHLFSDESFRGTVSSSALLNNS